MPVNSFEHYPMSWHPNKAELTRPVYRSLAAKLEEDIRTGVLLPNTKLPPQRELADFLDLNFTTVTRAYKLCALKGLTYAVTGRGTYVSPYGAAPATITQAGEGDIDLGFVASFEQCNGMLLETIESVLRGAHTQELLDYRHPRGMPHHLQAAASWLDYLMVPASREQLSVVSGTQNGLALCLLALFPAGSRVAVDRYTYANFIELAKLHQLQLLPVQGDEWGMRPDELVYHCRHSPVQGVFLMPSCCNPTTVRMGEQRKRDLAAVIRQYGLLLIEDDIHAFLTAHLLPDYQGPLCRFVPERSIYHCGTSKSICSGLRVAFLLSSPDLQGAVEKAIYNVNVKTSSLDIEIIAEAILNGTAQKIVARKRTLAEKANRIFDEIFPAAPASGHPYSFYRWLPIQSGQSGLELERYFLKAGVRVYHADRFLSAEGEPQQFLRVSLTNAPSAHSLKQGLDTLAVLIARLGGLDERN